MSLQVNGGDVGQPGLLGEIARLGPWFHNLRLGDGITTAPEHPLGDFPSYKWEAIGRALPEDLTGWRALDIGCNAGFYTFELAKRGASVVGIDHDPHYLAQAAWASHKLGLAGDVELRQMDVYHLDELGERFDLVLFLGVLYHLRYPLLGLDLVTELVDGLLVIQTLTMSDTPATDTPATDTPATDTPADIGIKQRRRLREPGWPTMAFIEHELAGDPTNWWVANEAAVEAMVRTTGLRVLARPGHEMWLCERESPSRHSVELARAVHRGGPSGPSEQGNPGPTTSHRQEAPQ